MNIELKNIIEEIYSRIIRNDCLKKGLLSFTVHGSCTKICESDRYIDYDAMFIYSDESIIDALKSHENFLSSICEEMSSEDVVCFYTTKSGPMHPLKKTTDGDIINLEKKKVIFLHISIFSESDYSGKRIETAPSPLLANEWQKLQPNLGVPLGDFRKIPKLEIKDLIYAGLGIDDCIQMLKTQNRGHWVWENQQMKWGRTKLTDFDDYEMIIYSLKWCIHNSVEFLSQILPIKKTVNKEDVFTKHFIPRSQTSNLIQLLDFCNKVKDHRINYSCEPITFRKKYNVSDLQDKIISILISVKERLLSINLLSEFQMKLPSISKEVPINISIDLRKMFNDALQKKPYDKVFIITDANISSHYDLKPWVSEFNISSYEYVIEDSTEKSPVTLLNILKYAEEQQLTRSTLTILFGGGSVGNLGGMVAGLYHRGIDFIHIPTTLLAQLDSSVGCKQSVNGFASKNKFGLFHPPESININILFNATLNEGHVRSGLMEALKHGLCQSNTLADEVIDYCNKYLNNDNGVQIKLDALEKIIIKTIELKLQYMTLDPLENSPEQHLELGHKIGHALEFASKETVPHGISVAFGTLAEAYLFYKRNLIEYDFLMKILSYTKQITYGLSIDDKCLGDIKNTILLDNKRKMNEIPIVLLDAIENPKSVAITLDEKTLHEIDEAVKYAKSVLL